MANTVNDVMNVIASPDYGIKNIAGTNQEILAILQGTHNSKNNIHSIVDDIRSLLQELIVVSTESKSIEIGEKTSKINPKNIQDILDETKGIRKAIINLAKIFEKQGGKSMPTVAKLSNKASERVADAMIKDLEKQKKGGGMAAIIDAFTKLKNISLKDIIFGKLKLKQISKIFKNVQKDLNIKEKDLNAVIKMVNAAPEMIKSLSKIGWRVDKIIKNDIVKKLSDILIGKNSILTISQKLQKQKKVFANAYEAAKNIKGIISSFNKTMMKLMLASLLGKFANGGIKSIQTIFSKLMPLVKTLNKNKKDIEKGIKVAKKITILVGNLLLTTVFLTAAAVTGIPAILGALILWGVVKAIIPAAKLLAKNKKHISRAIGASIVLLAFTGLMALTSLVLSSIEKIGKSALIGSAVILGVVAINVLTYFILSKALKTIAIGAISMTIMSISLLLFGIALGKITKATEKVTFKQIGMIAAMTVLLTGCVVVLGIPQVASLVMLGSIALAVMSVGLLVFSIALGKISKATEKLKFKQILLVSGSILALGLPIAGVGFLVAPLALGSIALTAMSLALRPFLKTLSKISKATKKLTMKQIGVVAGSMGTLGLAVAGMALLTIPIGLGAIALGSMSSTLYTFVKSLKMISDMGSIPKKEINDVISVMKSIGNFFKKNALSFKAMRSARKYKRIMKPFGDAASHLVKLNKIKGAIPTELVYQTLDAMRAIGTFFVENPIEKKVIKVSRMYKRMLKPFGKTVKRLSKLKDMGGVPMELVYQTLDAMRVIANYYTINPIEKETIKQSRKYKRMMRPFGKTLKHLAKLQKMGNIPIGLVYQTLDAMQAIANYYVNNPIERETIKQSKKYKRMMRPFGKTLGYLSKLQKMGNIPIGLVYQTLDAMRIIANYYINNPIERKAIKQSRKYKRMLKPFGKTLGYLSKLQKMGNIPIGLVRQTLKAMSYIANYFNNNSVDRSAIKSARRHKKILKHFSGVSEYLSQLKDISNIDAGSIKKVTSALFKISLFYKFAPVNDDVKTKGTLTKEIITLFLENAEQLKNNSQSFTFDSYRNILLMTLSMETVFSSLKKKTLKLKERRKARKSLRILSKMTKVMSSMSKINPADITSVGNALLNTLDVVNKVDISQVESVTNMFNAFKGINKSENIINKFTESVNAFTTACKNLMDAMSNNTDAINNISAIDSSGEQVPFVNEMVNNNLFDMSNANSTNQNSGIRIANVDEIARTIAEKINGALSVDVPDAQVQLLINGTGGNEWIISRY